MTRDRRIESAWLAHLLCSFSLAFAACQPDPISAANDTELADSAVVRSPSKTDEHSTFNLETPAGRADSSVGDAATPVDLPPDASIRDLAEEACPARHCLIDDRCFPQGAPNPLNACQWCDPTRSRHKWSALPDGAYCEDGLWCSVMDRCQLGFCMGQKRCEDYEVCGELDRACLPR